VGPAVACSVASLRRMLLASPRACGSAPVGLPVTSHIADVRYSCMYSGFVVIPDQIADTGAPLPSAIRTLQDAFSVPVRTASHLPTLPQGSVLAIVYEGSSTYTHSWHHFGFGEILTEFVVKN
jgi:hypothetical protein